MEHVVFFPTHDGSPAFRRVPSLDEAVRLVEHLRNVEGVAEVSVHALTEVPLAFRAYYRVEVPGAAEPAVATAGLAAAAAPAEQAPPAALPAPVELLEPPVAVVPAIEQVPALQPVAALAGGRAADTKTSLGFFVS